MAGPEFPSQYEEICEFLIIPIGGSKSHRDVYFPKNNRRPCNLTVSPLKHPQWRHSGSTRSSGWQKITLKLLQKFHIIQYDSIMFQLNGMKKNKYLCFHANPVAALGASGGPLVSWCRSSSEQWQKCMVNPVLFPLLSSRVIYNYIIHAWLPQIFVQAKSTLLEATVNSGSDGEGSHDASWLVT